MSGSGGDLTNIVNALQELTRASYLTQQTLLGGLPGTGTGAGYTLPAASTTVLGGVKVDGTTVTIAAGVISASGGGAVTSVATRTGAVVLAVADVSGAAPLASPAFTGTPALPTGTTGVTQTLGNTTTLLATTAFVAAAVTAGTAGVATFNTRTGAVVLSAGDVTTALTFTPYNATNPTGYQTSAQVSTAVGVETARAMTAQTWINVKSAPYNAACDNTTDDTAALQAAITANYGGVIYLPGFCKITSPINITGKIGIEGAGCTSGGIAPAATNQVGLNVTTAAPCSFQNFGIIPTASGVTGIQVNPSGTSNSESTFRDLHIIACAKCIDTQNAQSWVIENCHFENFTTLGVNVRCTANPDAGDSMISNCYFLGPSTANVSCIQQQSSGGLKLSNNKFLGTYYGYSLFLDAGAVTGLLNITGNSFDGCLTGIELGQGAAGGTFHDVVITGNDFNLCNQAIGVTNSFATPGWLLNLIVSGNSVYLNNGGTAFNLNGVNGFTIGPNEFYTPSTATATAINIGVASSNGLIIPCNRAGNFANYVLNAGSNVTVQPKIQRGSGSTATSGAYGSALFTGSSGTISFPFTYLGNTPKVFVTPNATGLTGPVSAFAISIGLSSFVAEVVGVSNTTTISYDWVAYGDW